MVVLRISGEVSCFPFFFLAYDHMLTELAGGDWWTDEYNVKPIGILQCPTLKIDASSVDVVSEGNEEEWEIVK